MPVSETGFRGKPAAITGLLVAFGWIFVSFVPGISGHNLTDARDDIINIVVKWCVVLILAVIAFGIRRWTPSELGIRALRGRDLLAAVGAFLIALVLSGAASRLVVMPTSLDMHKLAAVPFALRFGVVLTAAVSEEFLYRGYAIEELASLMGGNYWIAGLLSLAIFTASHARLYGFSRSLIIPALVAQF
jgi:uncharacterized protein